MESISSNLKNQKEGYRIGLKTVGIWAGLQLYSPHPISVLLLFKKQDNREFPGSPVIRTWLFHCRDLGSIPGQGTETPQEVTRCSSPKRKTTGQNGVTYTKPHITKTELNHSFCSPRNAALNRSLRNRLVSTSSVSGRAH